MPLEPVHAGVDPRGPAKATQTKVVHGGLAASEALADGLIVVDQETPADS